MMYYESGSETAHISDAAIRQAVQETAERLGIRRRVLVLPPDITRLCSYAGRITELLWEHYGTAVSDIMPATGTHTAMTLPEIHRMFGRTPDSLFRAHEWKKNLVTLGTVPAEYIHTVSEGLLSYEWPAQVDPLLAEGGHDVIFSVGQVVPHEVIGMANYTKNIFVGCGGKEGIDKSHFLGAVYGMERIMGRADSPVRSVLQYAADKFASALPIVYILTVVGRDETGGLCVRGLFIGDDAECYYKAAALAQKVNFCMLEEPLKKVVVYMDPSEYRTTWLANKSIYRTRMAIADGGELVVLAPGVSRFGEDPGIDSVIRTYGYCGRDRVLEAASRNDDLAHNLSAAAHLIHGSSEGRFSITYAPGTLSREETEHAGYAYASYEAVSRRYNPAVLKDGWNTVDGERVYYISRPAIGLWACRSRFEQ